MSIIQRLALVIRSYFADASDRIDRIAMEEEARETAARRKALEEMRGLSASETPPTIRAGRPVVNSAEQMRLAADYRLLGLNSNADLGIVEEAWRGLASRADPKRFPAGSDEEKRAAEILNSINQAYERIRESLIPTEGRFGQLEL